MGKIIPKIHIFLIALVLFSFVNSSFSAIKRDTKLAKRYRAEGYEAQRAGNLDMALSYYQRAVEADPYYAVSFNDIGVILEAKGINDKAKEAYLRAISIDRKLLSAYYNLASIYEKEGDLRQAVHYWKMRIQLGDWGDVWTWKAKDRLESLKKSGELEALGIDLDLDDAFALTQDSERDAEYHAHKGRRYVSSAEYVKAVKEFSRAVLLDPSKSEYERLLEEAERRALLYK